MKSGALKSIKHFEVLVYRKRATVYIHNNTFNIFIFIQYILYYGFIKDLINCIRKEKEQERSEEKFTKACSLQLCSHIKYYVLGRTNIYKIHNQIPQVIVMPNYYFNRKLQNIIACNTLPTTSCCQYTKLAKI